MGKEIRRLAFITDPHLNFLAGAPGIRAFGQSIGETYEFDAVLLTGDITEYPHIEKHLREFQKAVGKPVFFILGNHDYYHGSFAAADKVAKRISDGKSLIWLASAPTTQLTDSSCLIGQDGLYDVRCGRQAHSTLVMSDFFLIKDLAEARSIPGGMVAVIRKRAEKQAELAHKKLREVSKRYAHVYFATHYPPFREASLSPAREMSDHNWAPFFVSTVMGTVLSEIATEFPYVKFTVLCGHTHTGVTYRRLANLVVRVGDSKYTTPRVSDILEVP